MRFHRFEACLVRLPLKQTCRVADAPVQFCETVLVRLESDGVAGWGEVTPGNAPYLTGEWSGATYLTLRDCVAPRLAEMKAAANAKSLLEGFSTLKGNNAAKAAVELAWQDLNARQLGQPLWKTIGGEKKPIKVGLTFDRSTERDAFFAALARANEENFARITLKMRPGWDVQVLNFARLDSPHYLQLQVDVEGALDLEMHADTLYRMDDFFLTCVEQPLNPRDFVSHAMLHDRLRTQICLDESIESIKDVEIALDLNSAGMFCLKPERLGGLENAVEIAKYALANNATTYVGAELTSSLAYRHLLALASVASSNLPTDYVRFEEVFEHDLVQPVATTIIEEPGNEEKKQPPRNFRFVELWDEPGIGVEPDLDALGDCVLDRFEVRI